MLGGHTIKLAPMQAGIPDRLVLMPGGKIFLVELKTENGELSTIQKHWHAKLKADQGIRVHVLYGREGAVTWLRGVVGALDPSSRPGRPAKQHVG